MRDRYLLPLLLMIMILPLGLGLQAHAQQQNRVALIMQHGDGSLVTRCVTFPEPYLTGYQILMRSGLDVVAAVGPLGAAICAIEGEGCEARNCFCSSPPNYWSYWKLIDGEWTYSQIGANSMQVHDGAIEGWTWGPGSPPPVIAFTDVCAPPATPTNIPTETPHIVPTATPETPEPSVTQVGYPPPTIPPSGEEAPPSPTSPPTPLKPYPSPSKEIEEGEGEEISDLDAEPSASDDPVRSVAQPEPSPTRVHPQATVVAQAEIQPTATTSPEANAVDSLAAPTDAETASARRLSSGYIIFAILTGGLVGLLILFGRR